MAIVIRPLETDADRDGCYAIRFEVFVDEQNVPPDEEIDSLDATALHFVVEDDGSIIGTARLVELKQGIGWIGRVALRKAYRGRGIGRDLVRRLMDVGFSRCHTLVLDAQIDVISFYEDLGFTAEGDVFMDCGIAHRKMRMSRRSQASPNSSYRSA